jgi:two-component system CheB/CheR fusion protein
METMLPVFVEVQDNEGHWYSLRIRPYRTLDNRIEGVVLVFIDIDSIKNVEQLRLALQHEERLAAVVRDSNDAVMVQDFSGQILAWNKRATEMFGYSEEEALCLNADMLLADRARPNMRSLIERMRRGEIVPPCESWRLTKSGQELRVWLTTSVLLDEAGKPASIAITEREMH